MGEVVKFPRQYGGGAKGRKQKVQYKAKQKMQLPTERDAEGYLVDTDGSRLGQQEFRSSASYIGLKKIPTYALQLRAKGISEVRKAIAKAAKQGDRKTSVDLIAVMNYNVALCNKELKARKA